MLRTRLTLGLGVFLVLCAQPGSEPARGSAVTTCGKVLWEFVGKPLTGVMVEKMGGLVFDQFADRLKKGRDVVVTASDIQTLTKRSGLSECELRQQLELAAGPAAYRPSPSAAPYLRPGAYVEPSGFSARSYCSRTGAVGLARGFPTAQQAMQGAVFDCINRGGVPECCAHGVQLVQ